MCHRASGSCVSHRKIYMELGNSQYGGATDGNERKMSKRYFEIHTRSYKSMYSNVHFSMPRWSRRIGTKKTWRYANAKQ